MATHGLLVAATQSGERLKAAAQRVSLAARAREIIATLRADPTSRFHASQIPGDILGIVRNYTSPPVLVFIGGNNGASTALNENAV